MNDVDTLNRMFPLPGGSVFKTGGYGALIADISNAQGAGTIAVQGAQILTWAPAGQAPVVWLSPATKFAPGKSLRGGAPVCWPWFGPHPHDAKKPAHGFARNRDWAVQEFGSGKDGTSIVMRFVPNDAEQAMWPHKAELTLSVTLGARLRAELTTRNTGGMAIELTQAIHTYFHVGDIASVRVEGLENCDYIDKMSADARIRQHGAIRVDGEVNRIYLGCPGDVVIVDESLRRRIRVAKQGSASCVVWNPWAETGARFGDMGPEGYRHMLCVETTNAASDVAIVAPGGNYTLAMEYSVEAL